MGTYYKSFVKIKDNSDDEKTIEDIERIKLVIDRFISVFRMLENKEFYPLYDCEDYNINEKIEEMKEELIKNVKVDYSYMNNQFVFSMTFKEFSLEDYKEYINTQLMKYNYEINILSIHELHCVDLVEDLFGYHINRIKNH